MANTLSGGVTLVFSIATGNGADETAFGIVQSVSINETTERAEAKGPDGHTYAVQEYDEKKELSMTYLERATQGGAPAIGTVFTYDSVTWYLSSISKNDTVEGFRSVEITATNYPNLGTPDI